MKGKKQWYRRSLALLMAGALMASGLIPGGSKAYAMQEAAVSSEWAEETFARMESSTEQQSEIPKISSEAEKTDDKEKQTSAEDRESLSTQAETGGAAESKTGDGQEETGGRSDKADESETFGKDPEEEGTRETASVSDKETDDAKTEDVKTQDRSSESGEQTSEDVLVLTDQPDDDKITDLGSGESMVMRAMLAASKEVVEVVINKKKTFRYEDYGLGDNWSTSMYHVDFTDADGNNVSTYAYCIQPSKKNPDDNDKATLTTMSDNKKLSRVLYYGTASLSGDDSFWAQSKYKDYSEGARWIIVHIAAAKAAGDDKWDYRTNSKARTLAETLTNYAADQPEIPDPAISLNGSDYLKVKAEAVEGKDYQVTPDITFEASEGNSITFTLPQGVRIYRASTGKYTQPSDGSKQVTIEAGDTFRVRAPLNQKEVLESNYTTFTLKGLIQKDLTAYKLTINNKDDQNLAMVYGNPPNGVKTKVKLRVTWISEPSIMITKSVSTANASYASMVANNSMYSLQGSKYGVYENKADATAGNNNYLYTLTCDANGETPSKELSLDSIGSQVYVRELSAGSGYQLDTSVKTVDLETGTNEVKVQDVPLYAAIRIEKKDLDSADGLPPAGMSLENIPFTIDYYDQLLTSSSAVSAAKAAGKRKTYWTIGTKKETDSDGKVKYAALLDSAHRKNNAVIYTDAKGQGMIPLGTISVMENAPAESTGYISEGMRFWFNGKQTKSSPYSVTIKEKVASDGRKSVEVTGEDNTTSGGSLVFTAEDHRLFGSLEIQKYDVTDRQKLVGAKFQLLAADGSLVKPTAANGITGDMASDGTITVASDGKARVNHLRAGTYRLKEIQAPVGYVTSYDSSLTLYGGVKLGVSNGQMKAGIAIQKVDKETGLPDPQGGASFAGASFDILADGEIKIGSKLYHQGDLVYSGLTLDEKGQGRVSEDTLTYGSYLLRETKAPAGMLAAEDIPFTISETDAGKVISITVEDAMMRGGVRFAKRDAEALEGVSQGEAKLAGAEFTLYNRSEHAVLIDEDGDGEREKLVEPGQEIIVLVTDEQGIAVTAEDLLPYGHYEIVETKAPEGYLLPEETEGSLEFDISKEGEILDLTDKETSICDQVKRSDLTFRKIESESGDALAGIPFRITAAESGESHIVMTDKDGIYDSRRIPHSTRTNAGDETNGDPKAGLWFGLDKSGNQVPVNDEEGALPYGRYIIEELSCDKNANLVLWSGSIEVSEDDRKLEQAGIDLGDVVNEKKPEIHTSAADKNGSKVTMAVEKAVLIDTVSYERLTIGSKYQLTATLMNKESGKPVLKEDGSPVSVQKEFVCQERYGKEDVEFVFDAGKLEGKAAVVFEELTLEGEFVAEHKDLEDTDQTVEFPKIGTSLTDRETGEKEIEAGKDIELSDLVEYTHLIPGQEYRIVGTLMNKDNGKALKDDKGKVITAESSFVPEKSEGKTQVIFRVKGEKLAGKTTVAFESLYLSGNLLAEHKDLKDKKQTVTFTEKETESQSETHEEGKPKETTKHTKETEKSSGKRSVPKTGDETDAGLWLILFAAAAFVTVSLLAREANRRKH